MGNNALYICLWFKLVLSPDVLDRLRDAQCAMPDGTFCFTMHPSSVNEGAAEVQCRKRAAFLHECKLLSAHVQVLADPSKKLADALDAVDILLRQNHQSVMAFCNEQNIVPKPRSFFYCPHDVVNFVYESLTSAGVDDSTAGRILGSQLWLSNDDYDATDCRGAAICKHGKVRYHCAECEDSGICVHGARKYFCAECGGKRICEHNRKFSRSLGSASPQ